MQPFGLTQTMQKATTSNLSLASEQGDCYTKHIILRLCQRESCAQPGMVRFVQKVHPFTHNLFLHSQKVQESRAITCLMFILQYVVQNGTKCAENFRRQQVAKWRMLMAISLLVAQLLTLVERLCWTVTRWLTSYMYYYDFYSHCIGVY